MQSRIFASGLLGAGAVMALWGLSTNDQAVPAPTPAAVSELVDTSPDAARDPAAVVSFFQDRVEAYPDSFLDRTQLGVALTSQARAEADLDLYAEAEEMLRSALDHNEQHAPAQVALGRALHAQHEFAEAQTIADARLADAPTDLRALALFGDTQLELGDVAGALDSYRQLESQERSAPVISRLARAQYALGRPDVARDLAEEALDVASGYRLAPSDAAFYHFQVGHFRFSAGDVDGAIDALETARVTSPGHPGTTEKLAFVLASVGRAADAEILYLELLEAGAAPDLHGSYADLLEARGATAEAEQQEAAGAELAEETRDQYPAERRHLVDFYLTRDPAVAVELAEADLATRQDWGAYDTLGWALFHDGQVDRADDVMSVAIELGVRDASVLYHAAEIADANGDRQRAKLLVDDALELNAQFHPFEAGQAVELAARLR